MSINRIIKSIIPLLLLNTNLTYPFNECENWTNNHPEWIFCDDFESSDPLVTSGRYFEYDDNDGDFQVVDNVGLGNSRGMEVVWQQGEVGAGSIKLAFGRNPNAYMNKQQITPNAEYREIYYRMYLKMEDGWQGNPAKLSRATVFTSASDWRQAMIAHLWSDGDCHLLIDPASCIDDQGNVECTTYNDFDHLQWLGYQSGTTPLFDAAHDDTWFCIEHHVRLNDPGQSNGLQEFWIDDSLEARRENLNFTGTYTEYAINAIFFENYWNDGSLKEQKRYFDNIVVSTERIGSVDTGVAIENELVHPDKIRVKYYTERDRIVIALDNAESYSEDMILSVYNVQGIRVGLFTITGNQLINGYAIATKQLPSGIYFIRISPTQKYRPLTILIP